MFRLDLVNDNRIVVVNFNDFGRDVGFGLSGVFFENSSRGSVKNNYYLSISGVIALQTRLTEALHQLKLVRSVIIYFLASHRLF